MLDVGIHVCDLILLGCCIAVGVCSNLLMPLVFRVRVSVGLISLRAQQRLDVACLPVEKGLVHALRLPQLYPFLEPSVLVCALGNVGSRSRWIVP